MAWDEAAYQRGYRDRLSYRLIDLMAEALETCDRVAVERAVQWVAAGASINGKLADVDRLAAAAEILDTGGRTTALRRLGFNAHWVVALLAWWDREHDSDKTADLPAGQATPGDRYRTDDGWWEIVGTGRTGRDTVTFSVVPVSEPNSEPVDHPHRADATVQVLADLHDRLVNERFEAHDPVVGF